MARKNNDDSATKQRVVKKFFKQMTAAIEKKPDDDLCIIILKGTASICKKIEDPIILSNFEIYWHELYQQIKELCSPVDLKFYKKIIDDHLCGILDAQRQFN